MPGCPRHTHGEVTAHQREGQEVGQGDIASDYGTMTFVLQIFHWHRNEVVVGDFVEQKEAMVSDDMNLLDTGICQLTYSTGALLNVLFGGAWGQADDAAMARLVQGCRVHKQPGRPRYLPCRQV